MQNVKLKFHFIKVVDQIKEVVKDFFVRGGQEGAALLTLTTLLGLVPLLTIIYSVGSLFPALGDSGQQLQDFILSNLLHESGMAVIDHLKSFSLQAKSLTGAGIVFLMVTSILMLKTIDTQINKLWVVSPRKLKLNTIVLYWAILTIGPVLLGGILMIDTAIKNMAVLNLNVIESGFYIFWIKFFSFLLGVLVLSLCYTLIPNTKVPFLMGMCGAMVAVLFIYVLKQGFAMYLEYFPSYKLIYGAFVAIPLFIVWIYANWCLVIIGAIITKHLTYHRVYASEQSSNMAVIKLLLLDALLHKQQQGQVLDVLTFHHEKPFIDRVALHQVIDEWEAKGLVSYTHDDNVVLIKALEAISWLDLSLSYESLSGLERYIGDFNFLSGEKILAFVSHAHEEIESIMRQSLDAMCQRVKQC